MATTLPLPVLRQLTAVLERVPLFETLSRDDLKRIAVLVRARSIGGGQVLFRAGDAAHKFYIIQSGAVEIVKEDRGGAAEVVDTRHAGDTLGELALLSDRPRVETARALKRTELLVIGKEQFAAALGLEKPGAAADPLLDYSRTVQSALMPLEAPQTADFQLAGGIVRGDAGAANVLWDAFAFRGGGIICAVLRAGSGPLPAAHLLSVTRALLREIAASEDRFERVLPRLGRAVPGNMIGGANAAVGVALVHVGHVLTFAVAGRPAVMVLRNDGTRVAIGAHGPALGATADFAYGTTRVGLAAEDIALTLSDDANGAVRAIELIERRRYDPVFGIAADMEAALLSTNSSDDAAFVIARRQEE